MKKIYTSILLAFITITCHAQWTRTHVSVTTGITIEDMCEHNGSLYVSVFDSGLVKLNETTNTWEKVKSNLPPSSNAAHISKLASVGNYLYAFVSNQSCASTTIYKSTDNGATFITDTIGHPTYTYPPNCKGYPASVANVYVFDGQLITVVNGGFLSKKPTDAAWVRSSDPNVKFSEKFGKYNTTWYAVNDKNKLYTTTDSGQTWTISNNTGLPTFLKLGTLNINPSNGRIYLTGTLTNGEFRLMYSDNSGSTWDSLAMGSFIKKSWLGQTQSILDMISNGNDITAMLVNDANNSHPDVIKSTDGGQTFVVDTVGLQANAFGTVQVARMLYFKGKLYLAPNYHDVYTQGNGTSSLQKHPFKLATVYPNPFKNTVTIESKTELKAIRVFDFTGQLICNEITIENINTIDLSRFENGIYFIQLVSENETQVCGG